jgi:ABC-2 type transport system permease protein
MNRQSPVLVLAHKELSSLFNSAATYVICVVFFLITGWLFISPFFLANESTIDTFLRPMPLIFTFLIPALTMRSFAEEFRSGTIEYLATLPIKDYEIVLGKYIAAMGLLMVLLGFTLTYPLVLWAVGRPDPGQVIGGYISLIGLGSFFAAIGLWASSMTRNQVVAFIMAFFVCFIFYLLSHVADLAPGILSTFLKAWSVEGHFDAMARGVIDSRDLLYWLSGTVFFLASGLAALHSRRWR